MPYVALNYLGNNRAPLDKWACAPTSSLGPYSSQPTGKITKGLDLCGQCVSFVKQVCPALPLTSKWKKGAIVKDNKSIKDGTVIATFNGDKYEGHAAIYVKQDDVGITVYDQWCTGAGKPIGERVIGWNHSGISNNGSVFYVVELKTN